MPSLVSQAPCFSMDRAAVMVRKLYGLEGSLRELPGERDQNFRLTAESGEEYVLKVANAAESGEVLEFQNKALAHLLAKAEGKAVCPRVRPTLQGREIASWEAGGKSHLVRLLTYLPGRPLALVRPHDRELLTDLGRFFGRLDLLLEDFDHPAVHREFHWDLARAGQVVEKHLAEIQDPERRKLAEGFLAGYRERTEPLLAGLPQGVIHNDGNDYNVLVRPEGRWSLRVAGVIDFGDMVHSHLVNEAAIVCAYAMLGKNDPLTAAGLIVGGYNRARNLSEEEISALFDLICLRLCASVCHSAHQSRMEPDNEYLRISEKPAWALLAKLEKIHPRQALYLFRENCGRETVPGSGRIAAWLAAEARNFSGPVEAELRVPDLPVLDLGVDSPLLDAGPDPEDPAGVPAVIAGIMAGSGTGAALGRYGEPRLIYDGDDFKSDSEELPERRTIHLGVDLFLKSGTPIKAFMEGRVHSWADNAAPLDYGPAIVLEHRTGEGDTFYTFYGHLSRDSLQGLEVGRVVPQGGVFARIGESGENGGWPPHLHFQIILDMLGLEGTFPGVARPGRASLWKAISPDPNLILNLDPGIFPPEKRDPARLMEIRGRNFGGNLSLSYRKPLKIVRGRGQYLFSHEGQRYLDGVNNVCHVGHCHPKVVAAGQRQMAILNTNTRYLHDNIVEFGRRLLARFPDPLNVCFFTNSGSEANELALRMARTCTGRKDLMALEGAYHGNTQALIEISPYKHDGPGGKGSPDWVRTVTMPDGYRGPHKGTGPETGEEYAGYVGRAVEEMEAQGRAPAAFICESMLGCGGQVVLPENYMKAAFAHVREAGGLCVADEVQVGFGRAGVRFWAFETQDVVPDIVTLGKPIGNGHPLAAVVTTREIADTFANGMEYFNTFGGNPVSCAIGQAVLEVIEEEGLQENSRLMGQRLLQGLEELRSRYPLIGDVRGLGLYVGAELVRDPETLEPAAEEADHIINRAKDFGILLSTDGPLHNILKLKPPLVINKQDIDRVIEVLDSILGEDRLRG